VLDLSFLCKISGLVCPRKIVVEKINLYIVSTVFEKSG